MVEIKLLVAVIVLMIVQSFNSFEINITYLFSFIEILILIYLLFRLMKKREANNINELNGEQSQCDQKILQLMRVSRHDWQNHLQVILGYLSLKKYDQISNYIARVNRLSRQFSIISAFQNSNLAAFLYMLPVNYPKFNYELEVAEELEILTRVNNVDSNIYIRLIEMLDILYKTVEENPAHSLIINLARMDNTIILNFEYEGNISSVYDEIIYLNTKLNLDNEKLLIDLYNEREFIMEFHFQLVEN